MPTAAIRAGGVAYCAGVGEDMTFDRALHDRGMTVRAFDPTPRAVAHVGEHRPKGDRYTFDPVGWWSDRRVLRFYSPADPGHVSHSATNLQQTSTYFEADVAPVTDFVEKYGDELLSIVKMDIEGAEHEVLSSLLATTIRPYVLAIEFDQPQPCARVVARDRELSAAGYVLVKIERWNYTYVHRALDGA